MYHRPLTKRPQVFGMPSMSQRGQHVRFVIARPVCHGMFGVSSAWRVRREHLRFDEHVAAW
jgi:hypothetical protein